MGAALGFGPLLIARSGFPDATDFTIFSLPPNDFNTPSVPPPTVCLTAGVTPTLRSPGALGRFEPVLFHSIPVVRHLVAPGFDARGGRAGAIVVLAGELPANCPSVLDALGCLHAPSGWPSGFVFFPAAGETAAAGGCVGVFLSMG